MTCPDEPLDICSAEAASQRLADEMRSCLMVVLLSIGAAEKYAAASDAESVGAALRAATRSAELALRIFGEGWPRRS